MIDRRTLGLRLALSLSIVAAMAIAGFMHRSPWMVLVATPAFTLLYALGKWNAWKAAWAAGGARQILIATLISLPIQAIVAGVFYLLGLGVGKIVSSGTPLATLSSTDVAAAAGLTAVAAALSAAIIRIEAAPVIRPCFPAPPPEGSPYGADGPELELDLETAPLTPKTFFLSAGYWRADAARDALENSSGGRIEKKPLAAREDMIAEAERRLGVRLPEGLRALYRRCNGGYVGPVYVAMKPEPGPVYDDWRGAFSIDYSSLAPLENLRSVRTHYEDWTDDPEDFPEHADKRIVLQARYGDMTLLDYSDGPEPRILIVDYDKHEREPVDIAFDSFDAFFAALRREKPWRPAGGWGAGRDLGPPLAAYPEAERPARFWGEATPHAFHHNAENRAIRAAEEGGPAAGPVPRLLADDALVRETEARLGIALPPALLALWRFKNGGGVSHRWISAPPKPDGRPDDFEALRRPVPLEHVATLGALSDRVDFPAGETPWRDLHAGADRLVVIEADNERAALLDYRASDTPAVLLLPGLDAVDPAGGRRFESFDALLAELRAARRGHDDVAKRLPD